MTLKIGLGFIQSHRHLHHVTEKKLYDKPSRLDTIQAFDKRREKRRTETGSWQKHAYKVMRAKCITHVS